MSDPARLSRPVVNSHNEWDPLEENLTAVSTGARHTEWVQIKKLSLSGEGDDGPTGSVP
jgi:hypothetical protein